MATDSGLKTTADDFGGNKTQKIANLSEMY